MFNNIIGNEANKEILKNIVENNNISHSYIFSGISGIGKFMFAKEFAKAILCTEKKERPCNNCKSCESFDNSNNPDVIIIDEKENSIKTEQIKELTNDVLEKPIQGDKKIYIINNSENMTKEAQNSLLKTLEEPPAYIIIILITNNENLLLNTIKSRCITITFNKLSDDEIKQYFTINSETIDNNMINAFGGSIEKALILKDKKKIFAQIDEIFKNIENMNELQILNIKDTIFKDKEDVLYILDYINTIFYDKIIKNIYDVEKFEDCIKIIEDTKLRLKKNNNYDMAIDNCLFAIERRLETNG